MQGLRYQFTYRLSGSKALPKLLFLHGFMGAQADFDALIAKLEGKFCCLIVDLPGHGQTVVLESEVGYKIDAIATGLIELLQSLNFTPCHLMGYSMGGRLALFLACRFPQHVLSVLLESASPGLASEPERIQRQQQDERLAIALETGSWVTFLAQWYARPLFATLCQHPDFETLLHRRSQNNPEELAKILRGLGTGHQPSLWEELHGIEIPIQLVVGVLDSKFVDINHKMIQFCQKARLSLVPNCGHNVHFEQPQALAEILKTHIASRE